MTILQQRTTQLGGASNYGAGTYGFGTYGTAADNFVVISPTPGEVWSVDYIACTADSQSFTQFSVYLNSLDATGLLGNTINGNMDLVEFPEMVLRSADMIVCVWFGGDAGANATATAVGGIFEP